MRYEASTYFVPVILLATSDARDVAKPLSQEGNPYLAPLVHRSFPLALICINGAVLWMNRAVLDNLSRNKLVIFCQSYRPDSLSSVAVVAHASSFESSIHIRQFVTSRRFSGTTVLQADGMMLLVSMNLQHAVCNV